MVYADWKEVWCNAVKQNWTITYFTSVLNLHRSAEKFSIIETEIKKSRQQHQQDLF